MYKDKKVEKFRINMTPFEIFNSVVLLFIAVMVFIGVMWMGGTLMGYGGLTSDTYYGEYKPMIIISESMTPTIEVNGLLLIDKTPFSELKEGDIIVFDTIEYGLVGHRIISELEYGFKTKGDNNKVEDNWIVTESMYKGKVAEIHNEWASVITILFGDLDNLSLGKLFLGFLIIAVVVVLFLRFAKWVYDLVFVYYFLIKKGHSNSEYIVKQYYPNMNTKIDEKELKDIFSVLKYSEYGFFKTLKLRYNILRLHNVLQIEQKTKRRFDYLCSKVRKDMN